MIDNTSKEEYIQFLAALITIRKFCLKHLCCGRCPLNSFCNDRVKLDKGKLNTPVILYTDEMMKSIDWSEVL